MSNIIYVVPWAICDTDSVYVKKIPSDVAEAHKKGDVIDDWCVKKVVANPDRRSKDVYAIVDVYNGYDEKVNDKGIPVFELNNTSGKLMELGYSRAEGNDYEFITKKILKSKTS